MGRECVIRLRASCNHLRNNEELNRRPILHDTPPLKAYFVHRTNLHFLRSKKSTNEFGDLTQNMSSLWRQRTFVLGKGSQHNILKRPNVFPKLVWIVGALLGGALSQRWSVHLHLRRSRWLHRNFFYDSSLPAEQQAIE